MEWRGYEREADESAQRESEEREVGFQVDAICARGLGTGKRSQGLVSP